MYYFAFDEIISLKSFFSQLFPRARDEIFVSIKDAAFMIFTICKILFPTLKDLIYRKKLYVLVDSKNSVGSILGRLILI